MGNITGLRIINNHSSKNIVFENVENTDHNRTIAGEDAIDLNAWIPWCDNADQFKTHHMKLYTPDNALQYAIWQRGNKIYASRNFTFSNGVEIYPKIGVSVSLKIAANLSITMVPYGG